MELLTGFEPVTSSLPRTRSTNWAIAASQSLLWYYSENKYKSQAKNDGILNFFKNFLFIFAKKVPETFFKEDFGICLLIVIILRTLRRGIRG